MTFWQTVVAIMNQKDRKTVIPVKELITFDENDPEEIVNKKLPECETFQIICLQTLIKKEYENQDSIDDFMKRAPKSFNELANDAGKFLQVQGDSTHRIIMLEGMIIEIVREAIPTEYDRLNVNYYINARLQLIWHPQERNQVMT